MDDKLRAAILETVSDCVHQFFGDLELHPLLVLGTTDALVERISRDFCLTESGDEKANKTMEQLLAEKQQLEESRDLAVTLRLGEKQVNDQLRRELDEAKKREKENVAQYWNSVELRAKILELENVKGFDTSILNACHERIAKLEAERDEYKSLYEKQLAGRQS